LAPGTTKTPPGCDAKKRRRCRAEPQQRQRSWQRQSHDGEAQIKRKTPSTRQREEAVERRERAVEREREEEKAGSS